MATTFPYLASPPLAFAHRGGAGNWPENTMPAFDTAVDLGYRHLETDVHLTSDGVLVAFHDDSLDRVTDRQGVIGELPWSEVRQARVDGREPIPLLEELLDAWPDVCINIDPKHDRTVEPLAAIINRTGTVDRVGIGSFSDKRIHRMHELVGPELCTAMGPVGVARLRAASYGLPAGRFSAPCVQVPPTSRGVVVVDERFVRAAHDHDIQVHVWTIDDPIEMTRLLDLGVDGIMTDRPEVLKELLTARGQWQSRR